MAPRRVIVSVDLSPALLRRVDRLARRLARSRQEIIGAAVAQYVARHDAKAVTTAMDRLAAQFDTGLDAPTRRAARRVLERSDW
jgi:predicted transcriptional regulator